MKFVLVSLFDGKALTYSPVQCVPNVNAFVRLLGDLINSPKSEPEPWVSHPEDFSLVMIGGFSDSDGLLDASLQAPETICQLSTLVRS